jgi:cation transport regulator
MRYESKNDLPQTIRGTLPGPAQELYRKAYNRAWEEYKEGQGYLSREGVAHQMGWTAVRHEYVQDQRKGVWYRIGEEPDETESARDFLGKLKVLFRRS